ncbi:MAG TPA: glycosyltransferase [Candidatus Methylomirabilis sp.]|nr:glycosyltransferase [Candidatus Methylomirabilis sp.]
MAGDLLYLVAIGAEEPRYLEAVRMCATSFRRWGRYSGELAVVTDRPEAIPADVRAEVRVVPVDERQMREDTHGREPHESYLLGRLRVHRFLDLTVYDRVMYADCDVLAIRDVMPLLDGLDCFRYSREFQPMSAPMYNGCLTDAELEEARWRRGINSGVFAAPGAYLGECLERWMALLDTRPLARGYDQPALNALVLRGLIRARPLPTFSVAYPVLADFAEHFRPQTCLLHYCGDIEKKFPRMAEHFGDLEQGRTPRLWASTDVAPSAPFFAPPPPGWRRRDTDHRVVVAFDDDGRGVESHALINAQWSRELQSRGHYVVPAGTTVDPPPDIVIHHNYQTEFGEAPRVAGARHVAVRTSDFGPFPRRWADLIHERYDALWVHSRWIMEQAIAGGVDPRRVRIVPHGVDPAVFRPTGARVPLPTRKSFTFLFVGGTVRRKGIDILLSAYVDAFRRDDDVCLVIKDHGANVFYREGTARDEIARLIADRGAPEILHMDRQLTAPQLAALYRACHVAVFPYRAEGFLSPALEALACGVPTILPRFGACLDFSDDETSFLVPAKRIQLPAGRTFRLRLGFPVDIDAVDFCEVSPRVLADTMRQAYEAPREILTGKGRAGARRVETQFTWRHVGDRIERLLRELVNGARDGVSEDRSGPG